MTSRQTMILRHALRAICDGGKLDPMTVEVDLRDYFAQSRSVGIREFAISTVIAAIEHTGEFEPPAH